MTEKLFTRRMMLAGTTAGLLLPGRVLGQSAETPVEGGIGGTGIVGLLTEFGSLIVSGNYVRTDDQTRFSDGFGPLGESDLRLGDSLTIEAAGPASDLVARRVHVTHPLVGVLQAVSGGGRKARVNGVNVRLQKPSGLRPGQRVIVPGLWQGQTVVADALRSAPAGPDLVSGDVARTSEFNVMRVGGTKVRGRGVGSLTPGSFATILGQFDQASGVMLASGVISGRFFGAAGPLKRLSVEGYLEPVRTAPGYRIAGLGHSFQRNLNLDAYRNERVLFNGAYTGKFAAKRAVILPEEAASRARILGRLARS